MTDFHELYTRYVGDIFRFALFLCGDAAEAEDITAETFARALTGKAPLVSSTVKGYLLTIARNLHLVMPYRRPCRGIAENYPRSGIVDVDVTPKLLVPIMHVTISGIESEQQQVCHITHG